MTAKFEDAVNARLDSIGCANCTGVTIRLNPDDGTFTIEGYLDKLDKTVDGVPVVRGMTLYREPGGYQFTLGEPCWDDLEGQWPSEYLRGADPTECCSTREAAEAEAAFQAAKSEHDD